MPQRCAWVTADPLYCRYHDEEWGVPVHDDDKIFEFLLLESAQAGLSWLTILKRREAYRAAFANFHPKKLARFGESDVQRLMQNQGIIRNEKKIRAAINNARCFLEVQKEFGSFSAYQWQFVGGQVLVNCWQEHRHVPATTPQSDTYSKDLKKRGFKFIGSTIIYAHMQATGMVNDHTTDCFRYRQLLPHR